MMLPSGNDAAEQVAYSLAGSRDTYVAWMNEKVASLGLRDTHFVTPSGMDADEHYSSAYDKALLARYAIGCGIRFAGRDARCQKSDNCWADDAFLVMALG